MPRGVYLKTEEHKRKIGKSLRGRKISEKQKKAIIESRKKYVETRRENGWWKNLKKTLRKMSKSRIGDKNPNWQGGISFEPYTTDWIETLKKSIRQRDKYTCQICEKEPAVHCHHIDYDKKNCNPDNLITLCRSCHTKTNFNRQYWQNYFHIKFLFGKSLNCFL